MYKGENSFKLPLLDERESRQRQAKKERRLRGCFTKGLVAGVVGLAACGGITEFIANNYFDYQVGSIEAFHKQESGGYGGAPVYDLLYFGSSCFFDKYWQNGHIIHSPTILSTNLGNKSIIIDPNLFECP
jgi:hypothetical protein